MVIARSAEAVTVVVAESLLLDGSGSDVVEETATLFVREVACAGAETTTVKVVDEPVLQLALVQVTEVLPALVQVHPPLEGVTDTKVTPAGRVSVRVTFAASEGPLLAALTV